MINFFRAKKMKQETVKNILRAFFFATIFLLACKPAHAALITGGNVCNNDQYCKANCASGLYEVDTDEACLRKPASYCYICKDKLKKDSSCTEGRNCISGSCVSGKCAEGSGGTDLQSGIKCKSVSDCTARCASGLYKEESLTYSPEGGNIGADGFSCADQKANEEPCTEDRNCRSIYCNPTTKKCEKRAGDASLGGTGGPQITDDNIPGVSVNAAGGVVKCGRPGGKMCTLCDLIKGINDIVQYLMKIAIGVALLAMAIGGVMYVISAGESAMMENAKTAIKNAAIGFVVVFAAYIIVNTTILLLGAKSDLGINARWETFDCDSSATQH